MSVAIAVGAACLVASGCGGGERELSAQQLVEEFNAHAASGVALELEEKLIVSGEAAAGEVFALALETPESDAAEAEGDGDDHAGSGSVVVLEGSEEALVEFSRCEGAIDFACYRAANVVLRFEGLAPVGQSQVAQTLQALSDSASTR